jgi:putative transcriptional regulator
MGKVQFKLEADGTLRQSAPPHRPIKGRIDAARVDATTEANIVRHAAEDDAEATRDAAAYARRVRRRTGLTQAAFAARIGVPIDTVRNWEQGKRLPAGPAKALLRILDRAPEAALAALG